MKIIVAAALFALALPLALFAHGEGASIEREVGEYLVDIGYDADPIIASSPVRFDFALYEKDGGGSVPFDRLWLRIEDAEKTLFAGAIAHAQFGATGALVLLPEEGSYTLFVRFEDDHSPIVELEAPITVAAGKRQATFPWWASVLSVVLALAAGFYFGRQARAR